MWFVCKFPCVNTGAVCCWLIEIASGNMSLAWFNKNGVWKILPTICKVWWKLSSMVNFRILSFCPCGFDQILCSFNIYVQLLLFIQSGSYLIWFLSQLEESTNNYCLRVSVVKEMCVVSFLMVLVLKMLHGFISN